jgi:hypothetical protein
MNTFKHPKEQYLYYHIRKTELLSYQIMTHFFFIMSKVILDCFHLLCKSEQNAATTNYNSFLRNLNINSKLNHKDSRVTPY